MSKISNPGSIIWSICSYKYSSGWIRNAISVWWINSKKFNNLVLIVSQNWDTIVTLHTIQFHILSAILLF